MPAEDECHGLSQVGERMERQMIDRIPLVTIQIDEDQLALVAYSLFLFTSQYCLSREPKRSQLLGG